MTFGEFTLTQKPDDLMHSMENAFRFFGGVTPYVTVDNQKAAVDKAHLYDPDMNPAFIDFANHWGFAVVPARPYRPNLLGRFNRNMPSSPMTPIRQHESQSQAKA